MDLQVRVLRTLSEIEKIRSAWESWPGNRDSEIDFYLTVLRNNSATIRPHVLLVERACQPDAILVGRIDRRKMDFSVATCACGLTLKFCTSCTVLREATARTRTAGCLSVRFRDLFHRVRSTSPTSIS